MIRFLSEGSCRTFAAARYCAKQRIRLRNRKLWLNTIIVIAWNDFNCVEMSGNVLLNVPLAVFEIFFFWDF